MKLPSAEWMHGFAAGKAEGIRESIAGVQEEWRIAAICHQPTVAISSCLHRLRALLTLDLIETSGPDSADATTGERRPVADGSATPACAPGEPALSPAPDFAAIGRQLGDYLFAAARHRSEYHQMSAGWLEANAHRFVTPAPAVVRNEAWWIARMREFWDRYNDPTVETTFHGTARHVFAKYLGADPAPAPAFDVEALVAAFEARLVRDSRGTYSPWAASEALRSVAREMLKGGGK